MIIYCSLSIMRETELMKCKKIKIKALIFLILHEDNNAIIVLIQYTLS